MLPYWYFPTYTVAGITFQTWGTFVSLGILVAVFIASRKARRAGIDPRKIWDAAFWIVIAACIGARLGHVFFYDWVYFADHLADIPKFWLGGFSSYGGFVGAIAAFFIVMRSKLFAIGHVPFADVLVSGLPIGWTIGRIGCFFIHDHPGTLTNFFLGVKYPDGIRHDLGLYDGLNTLGLAIFLLVFRKRFEKRPGIMTAVIALWYGTVRFLLDFLRAFDTRYAGLTPAQYGSIVLVAIGVLVLHRSVQRSKVS